MAGNKTFMTSLLHLLDDNEFMNNVISKHSGTRQVDVKDYLSLVEKILDHEDDSKSLSSPSPVPLPSTINELCCQITCEAQHTNDARLTMESIFDRLFTFPWDAKAVLTLSAFSACYAENWHLAQNLESDQKLGLAAKLRGQRPGMSAFEAFKDLIGVTLKFTKCIVEFANDPKGSEECPSIDRRVYQIIVGVLGCSVLFSGMISTSNEFPSQDLSTFSIRVNEKYESFKKQVEDFKQENEKKLQYKRIKGLYKSPAGIVKLVAELFCTEKDSPTVYHCFKKTTVKVQELESKRLLLLISDLTLSEEDIKTLIGIYDDSRFKSSPYEIMWVPIADVKNDGQFQSKRSQMRWYSCNSIVSKVAEKFIKKHWEFKQQTKVVVLNEKGEVKNLDAMPMICFWGSEALPFTRDRGCKLWKEHSNNWIKLVVNNSVFQDVKKSFESEELVVLYGSAEDSKIVKDVEGHLTTIKTRFSFVRGFNINTKRVEFLTSLERCIFMNMQVSTELSDPLTQDLLKLYTGCKKQSGFGIIVRGSSVVVHISLTSLEKVLSQQHEKWIEKVTNKQDFHEHFQDHYKKFFPKRECYKFKIPNMVGNIPEYKCPNCSRNMEKVVNFKCCHGKR